MVKFMGNESTNIIGMFCLSVRAVAQTMFIVTCHFIDQGKVTDSEREYSSLSIASRRTAFLLLSILLNMEYGRNQKVVKVPSDVSRPTVVGGYDAGGGQISNQHGTLSQSDITALTCSKCTFLLRNPRQVIKCGHRYCQQCIEQFTSGGYVFHPLFLLATIISHNLFRKQK